MSGWKAVWSLIRWDLGKQGWGVLFTFLFTLYSASACGYLLDVLVGQPDMPKGMYAIVDGLYLMVVPVCGLLFNKTAWAISRDDIYSKKLAHWRTMPVPIRAIVQARMLQGTILLLAMNLVFFFAQFGISSAIRQQFGLTGWLAAGGVWTGYGLAVNIFLIWIELGCSGKKYVRYYISFVIATMVAAVALTLGGVHLTRSAADAMAAGRYWLLALSALVAVLALYAGYRLTVRRMRTRSFAL